MPHASTARIVIVEQWSILRRGLAGTLKSRHTVVDGCEDIAEAVPLLQDRLVDVAIVGVQPGWDLVAVVARLLDAQPSLRLVLLSDGFDPGGLRAVLQAGASAVLSKKLEGAALLDALRRVLDGERVIDQPFLPLLFGTHHLEPSHDGAAPSLLTRREHDVLRELARGATNREIAEVLLMGESTVKSHLRRIYFKLDVTNRHGAVGRALELDLLS